MSVVTGDGPEILGYTRLIDYGTVTYAPQVGPVFSRERQFVAVGGELGLGMGDLTFELAGSSEHR